MKEKYIYIRIVPRWPRIALHDYSVTVYRRIGLTGKWEVLERKKTKYRSVFKRMFYKLSEKYS